MTIQVGPPSCVKAPKPQRLVRHAIGVVAIGMVSLALGAGSAEAFTPITNGDLIVSEANGQVNEFTPTGTFVQTFIPNASTPTGSAFDGQGNLYVTEFGANDILKVNGQTGAVSTFSNNPILGDGTVFNSPESIAFGPGFTKMYVSDANRFGSGGGIHVIDPATGKGIGFFKLPSSNGSAGVGESDWLALDPNANLFMTNEDPTQGVMQVNQSTGDIVSPSFAGNLPNIGYAMSYDPSGNLWLSDTDRILEYSPSGSLLRTITNPNFSLVFAGVFNPPFNTIYAGDLSTGQIYSYDLNGNLKDNFQVLSGIDGLSVAGTVLPGTGGGLGCRAAAPGPTTSAQYEQWRMQYMTSPCDGLVVSNASLGSRLMAEHMGVAYLNLTTCTDAISCSPGCLTGCAVTKRHIVLQPDADETAANDGAFTQVKLIAGPTATPTNGRNVPDDHLTLSSTYRVWLGPSGQALSSYLEVTQSYRFYHDIQEASFVKASCEPTAELPDCARFKTEITYAFHPGQGSPDHVQSLEAAERLHFTPDGLAVRGTTLTQDCDTIPICSNQLGNRSGCGLVLCVFPFDNPQNPIESESVASAAYPDPGIVDNAHQTADYQVNLPGAIPATPGCAACVHMHWRWGKAVSVVCGQNCAPFGGTGLGQPLLCDTPGQPYPSRFTACDTSQRVTVALVRYHSEETEGISTYLNLVQGGSPSQLDPGQQEWTQGSEPLAQPTGACYDGADLLSWGQCGVVMWLDDTASQANGRPLSQADSGTLFAWGGWFCSHTACRSAEAQFIDPVGPSYSVPGGGSVASLAPGQPFSIQYSRPSGRCIDTSERLCPSLVPTFVHPDVHFIADLLPPGTTNIHVSDPYGLCKPPAKDGSGLTEITCVLPYPLTDTVTHVSVAWVPTDCGGGPCFTITADAPPKAGTYANYTRAVWGSQTDSTGAGGNYRKADTIIVR